MRTRAQGGASPPSSPPRAQVARGRKRRSGSRVSARDSSSPARAQGDDRPEIKSEPEDISEATGLLTPRKAKRVRFSEPIQNLRPNDSSSTGLTPSLRRTFLLDDNHDALLKRKPTRLFGSRRVTMPARLDSSPLSSPVIQKVQYAPLRQIIDDRMRRRLRRNHLSEEINNIESQRREDQRDRKELDHLRVQGQQNNARIKDLMLELESQRQLAIQLGTEDELHAQALREELERLRQDIAARDDAEEERRKIEGSPTEFDSDEDLWDDIEQPTSPLDGGGVDTSSSSPVIRCSSPIIPSSPPAHVGVQTSPNTEISYSTHNLSEQLAGAQQQASDARAGLHLLHGELLALGFNDGTATSRELVQSIKDAFRQARLDLEYLLPGETPGGFENVLLLPAMLDHVRKLLAKARESDKAAQVSEQSESAMRTQFNNMLEKLQHIENEKTVLIGQRQSAIAEVNRKEQYVRDLELASNARAGFINERDQTIDKLEESLKSAKVEIKARSGRADQLQQELHEQQLSVQRLQNALESYRSEVTSLEDLVRSVEQGRSRIESKLVATDGYAATQKSRIDILTQTLTEVTGYVGHQFEQLRHGAEEHHNNHVKAFDSIKMFLEQQLSSLRA